MYTCTGCGKRFSFPGPFDDHRTGDHAKRERTCLETDVMIANGWTTSNLASGIVIWHVPMSDKEQANLEVLKATRKA